MKKACFSRTSVHKNFKNHFYPDPTRFPGPQTKYCPGKDLSNFRHGNLTPDRGIKYRNISTKSTKSVFMSDIMAETMVTGFKRLPQRAYLGGYTSCFGSRTHFQLATFYALTETPELGCCAIKLVSFHLLVLIAIVVAPEFSLKSPSLFIKSNWHSPLEIN